MSDAEKPEQTVELQEDHEETKTPEVKKKRAPHKSPTSRVQRSPIQKWQFIILGIALLYPILLAFYCCYTYMFPPFYHYNFAPYEGTFRQEIFEVSVDPHHHWQIPYYNFTCTSVGHFPFGKQNGPLYGWFVPSPTPSTTYAFFLHGAGVDRREGLQFVPLYQKLGINFVLFDLSQHGQSISRKFYGINYGAQDIPDFFSVLNFFASPEGAQLAERAGQPPLKDFTLHGGSNGGAIVLSVTGLFGQKDPRFPSHVHLRATVAENPYDDVITTASDGMLSAMEVWEGKNPPTGNEGPCKLPKFICPHVSKICPGFVRRLGARIMTIYIGYRYHFRDFAEHITTPLFLMHSKSDYLIPVNHMYNIIGMLWNARTGEKLQETPGLRHFIEMQKWTPPVTVWIPATGMHSAIRHQHPEEYVQRVSSFISQSLA